MSSAYDARGNRTRITHPDGAFFEYAYDTADRLFHLSENGPSITLASIFYDGEGRRDQLARDALGATTGYGYDPVSRLASLSQNLDGTGTANDASFGFGYNPASQIVSRSLSNNAYEYPVTSSTQSYAVNGRNQYTQVGGTAHAWDANGNLTSDGATTFGYDTENRLVSASGAKNASLAYDPLGRLYQVTSGVNTTRFVYDGDRLIAEYNGSGTLLRRYVHGSGVDEPLVWYGGAAVSSAGRRYLHANHQGSIVAASNAAGSKLTIHAYDPYGVTAAGNTSRFQYTGQAAILELGLLYYKARFYNPALGRFLQTDPIGYEDDVNLYAYVQGDPLNQRDVSGAWSTPAHDLIFRYSFGDSLPDSAIRLLAEGSRAADSWFNHDPGRSYVHSQINRFDPVERSVPGVSEARTRAFQDRQIRLAVIAALRGNNGLALWFLGQGMHPLSDGTSPVHRENGKRTMWPAAFKRHGEPGEGVDELTPELLEENRTLLRAYYRRFVASYKSAIRQQDVRRACAGSTSPVKCAGGLDEIWE